MKDLSFTSDEQVGPTGDPNDCDDCWGTGRDFGDGGQCETCGGTGSSNNDD